MKSSDGGQTWQGTGPGTAPNYETLAVAIDPTDASVVYMSHQWRPPNTVKSTDGGATWNPSDSGLSGPPHALAIDPSDPQHVFAGGGSNFHYSTDGGASWTPATTTLAAASSIAAAGGGLVYALGYDPVSGSPVRPFVSLDGGDTWALADGGLPAVSPSSLAVDPTDPAILYVGTDGGGLFKTSNGGASWSEIGDLSSFSISAIAVDPADPTDLFIGTVGTADGVLRSQNGGLTWQALLRGLDDPRSREINALVLGGPTLHAATPAGIFEYTSSDAAWPVPESVNPVSGPRTGGTSVTITGTLSSGRAGLRGRNAGRQRDHGGRRDNRGDDTHRTLRRGRRRRSDPDTQFDALVRAFVFDFDDVPAEADYHDDVVKLTASERPSGRSGSARPPDHPRADGSAHRKNDSWSRLRVSAADARLRRCPRLHALLEVHPADGVGGHHRRMRYGTSSVPKPETRARRRPCSR